MNDAIKQKLFELWMYKNHPLYFKTIGIINLILILSLVASIILSFFNVVWWWKASILIAVLFVYVFVINRLNIIVFVDEFNIQNINR